MTKFIKYAAASAAIGVFAAPVAAQSAYPYGYQQQTYQQPSYGAYGYQQQYPQSYQQQSYGAYGYQRGYTQNPVSQIIDQLLGNRYNVSDRQAVSQCASAAMTQAAAQYGNGYNRGYGQGYGDSQRVGALRVTGITDVQRRSNGLRVSGTMSSGGGYGGQDRYQNRGYAAADVSFRCNVDYRGAVTNVRIGRNTVDRRGY